MKKKLKIYIAILLVYISSIIVLLTNLIINYELVRKSDLTKPEVIKVECDTMEIYVDSLISEIQTLINMYPKSKISADSIVKYSIEYSIHPVFMISQGILESHLGTTGLAKRTNSVWNLQAFDNDHSRVSKYSDPNYSIKSYVNLIATDYLDDEVTEYDLMNNFTNHIGLRFASDPRYESKLSSIFKKLNNESIDSYYYSIIGA